MTIRIHRDFLKGQLLDTQRLKSLAGDHPLMSIAFQERETELRQQIEELPVGQKEARTVLFFTGDPVVGSQGIDAVFASRVIEPFQSMVMTDYADRCHGNVGNRGRRLGEARSRLLLTGLPRGSVGLELSKAPSEDLFAEDEVADTLSYVTRLIESSGRSDEEFAATLNETAPRVVQNLRTFLEVVAKGKAGLRIESGDLRCSMTPDEVASAFARVAATSTSDETIQIDGTLRGVLLGSWEFDFLDDNGRVIDGKIEDSLTQEKVAELNKSFFNEKCRAFVTKTTVTFRNGGIRTSYRLVDITAIAD